MYGPFVPCHRLAGAYAGSVCHPYAGRVRSRCAYPNCGSRFTGRFGRRSPHRIPLYAEPGPGVYGHQRGPVRGLLPVFLRRLDEEQPHTFRPGLVERVRQAVSGQPAVPVGHSADAGRWGCRAHRRPTADRRLFCRLHGRRCGRKSRPNSFAAGVGPHRRFAVRSRSAGAHCRVAVVHRQRRLLLLVRLQPGLRRLNAGHRLHGRGRAGPAGPRLLHGQR